MKSSYVSKNKTENSETSEYLLTVVEEILVNSGVPKDIL